MDKRLIRLISVIIIITGLAFWTCQSERSPRIYIAVSKYNDTAQFNAYKTWLHGVDSTIVLVDMYHLPYDSAMIRLEQCSGLLMSGGADIHPGYYAQAEDTILCEIDPYRDTIEMAILKKAAALKMPVFGICRGLQVINVFMGGSLYPDIPERLGTSVTHRNEARDYDCYHTVSIEPGSMLHTLVKLTTHEVNSVHHQGIHRLGTGLKVTAFSADSLPEAIEPVDQSQVPFMMAVQWHPERLGLQHPMSGPLAHKFVEEVKKYRKQQEK
jgi:putative glutamine amidotransferase